MRIDNVVARMAAGAVHQAVGEVGGRGQHLAGGHAGLVVGCQGAAGREMAGQEHQVMGLPSRLARRSLAVQAEGSPGESSWP